MIRMLKEKHSSMVMRLMMMVVVCCLWTTAGAQEHTIAAPTRKPKVEKPKKDDVKTPPATNTGNKRGRPATSTSNKPNPVQPQKPAATPVRTARWAADQLRKNMVRLEGGEFVMGVPVENEADSREDNQPAHEVSLSPFFIGKYEVTVEEWKAIMGNDPSDDASGKNTSSTCPVDNVDWNDCQLFIAKLKELTGLPFRLPTEAEWEFAARGGGYNTSFAGGDDIEDYGWWRTNSGRVKHPVGTKRPNGYGIYDMSGNVSEWCSDFYHEEFYAHSPSKNPVGPSEGSRHVVRGGSFFNQKDACEVTYRSYTVPEDKNKFLGLRLACSTEEE